MSLVWIIIDHPHYMPDAFVAERRELLPDSAPWPAPGEVIKRDTLEDLRDELARRGHHRFARTSLDDDPKAIEFWI
jgi:hypothetical protein